METKIIRDSQTGDHYAVEYHPKYPAEVSILGKGTREEMEILLDKAR